jgi:hypothetical protein
MFVILNGRCDGENTACVPLPTMAYLIFVEDIPLCNRIEKHIYLSLFFNYVFSVLVRLTEFLSSKIK